MATKPCSKPSLKPHYRGKAFPGRGQLSSGKKSKEENVMKKLVLMLLVAVSLSSGCTAVKVARQVGAFGGIPQVGAVNAKQVRAINAARNVAAGSVVPQVGATSAVGIASKLLRLIP
jgi:hypothetical protein